MCEQLNYGLDIMIIQSGRNVIQLHDRYISIPNKPVSSKNTVGLEGVLCILKSLNSSNMTALKDMKCHVTDLWCYSWILKTTLQQHCHDGN